MQEYILRVNCYATKARKPNDFLVSDDSKCVAVTPVTAGTLQQGVVVVMPPYLAISIILPLIS